MKKLLFCYLTFLCADSFASKQQLFYSNKLNRCTVTMAAMNDYEPMNFESTNNLLRKTGEIPKYRGERILIRGRVLDQNCVPVSDAKVYLWQTGTDGRYPYVPLRTRVDKTKLNLNSNSSFTGSGIATTNNKGEYYFITLFSKSVPFVNIRVEHRSLKEIETRLHLSNRNICTNECGELNQSLAAKGDIINYCLDIVLSGTTLKKY